jgi:hypothetical protein
MYYETPFSSPSRPLLSGRTGGLVVSPTLIIQAIDPGWEDLLDQAYIKRRSLADQNTKSADHSL